MELSANPQGFSPVNDESSMIFLRDLDYSVLIV